MHQMRELGYILIDHTHAAPADLEQLRAAGVPDWAKDKRFEASTFTCTHCGGVVFMNPKRTRERSKCSRCNHLICDECGAKYYQKRECESLNERIERAMEEAGRSSVGSLILPA